MLDREDRAILDFERSWWQESGAKDRSIEMSLGMGASDYYERLLSITETSEALTYDPLTVRRVRTLIDDGREEVAV